MTLIVFDTTALSHFARSGNLDALSVITQGHERVIPDAVVTEVQRGIDAHPALSDILALPWLTVMDLGFPAVVHLAEFKAELGGEPTAHLGECAVLALAKVHGGLGIVDDSAAVAVAKHHGVPVRGTLSLIVNGYRGGALTRTEAEALVDDLGKTMRLPVDGQGLFAWAYLKGHLP